MTMHAAEEPELLADDREDEVVVRVRAGTGRRPAALAEALPEQAAERQREEALDGLVALALRVASTGSRKVVTREQLVGVAEDDAADGGDAGRDQQQELPEAGAGHEEHRERGQRQDAGRAQVGLRARAR